MHLRSKTVQQLLSVILSVVMVLSMLPMEVLAQETPPVTTPMELTAVTEDTSVMAVPYKHLTLPTSDPL